MNEPWLGVQEIAETCILCEREPEVVAPDLGGLDWLCEEHKEMVGELAMPWGLDAYPILPRCIWANVSGDQCGAPATHIAAAKGMGQDGVFLGSSGVWVGPVCPRHARLVEANAGTTGSGRRRSTRSP